MVRIYDYEGTPRDVNVDLNDSKYLAAYIKVYTGDEVLYLVGQDGIVNGVYDSSHDRLENCDDGMIIIKRGGQITPAYLSDEFQKRKVAYDYLWRDI